MLANGRSVALVAAGGVLGAPARYAISEALPNPGQGYPTATFITNLGGALILGALLEGLARLGPDEGRRRSVRLLVGTGMCGAFTTYSTFAVESDQLLRAHRVGLAVAYALGTVVLGLLATGLGIAPGGRVPPAPGDAGDPGHGPRRGPRVARIRVGGVRVGGVPVDAGAGSHRGAGRARPRCGPMSPVDYLWVGLAGSAGAVARFLLDGAVKDHYAGKLPLGTMLINVTGSLVLGLLVGFVAFDGASNLWVTVAGTGFCGGYTTFSTASFETVRLIQVRSYRVAVASGGGTLVLGVAAAALGMALSQL